MYNDLQLRAFTQIAYIDLESKYNYYIANNSPFFTCLHLVYK